jgi:hypothetical protein
VALNDAWKYKEMLGHTRNMYGIRMEYVLVTNGISRSMHGICMEYVWNMYGIYMEFAWNTQRNRWFHDALGVVQSWNYRFLYVISSGGPLHVEIDGFTMLWV